MGARRGALSEYRSGDHCGEQQPGHVDMGRLEQRKKPKPREGDWLLVRTLEEGELFACDVAPFSQMLAAFTAEFTVTDNSIPKRKQSGEKR